MDNNQYYKLVDLKSGESMHYVGVHPIKWFERLFSQPDVGFAEADIDAMLEAEWAKGHEAGFDEGYSKGYETAMSNERG